MFVMQGEWLIHIEFNTSHDVFFSFDTPTLRFDSEEHAWLN